MKFDLIEAPALKPWDNHDDLVDGLKGMAVPVLNDGFVRLVDVMGDDQSIVQAARVSYGKGTRKLREDRGLIRYLMAHRHTTPFEMVEMKFMVRVPMDCWRQWIRHRTANVNEYSTRYSIAIDSCQKTKPSQWRVQSKTNKQGSEVGKIVWPSMSRVRSGSSPEEYLSEREAELQKFALEVYQERLAMGVAKEQARKDLPLSTYTEAYWKCDLHNIFHYLGLRLDPHAQLEIRCYAQAMAFFVQQLVPMAWEAFEDFRMKSVQLSNHEIKLLREMVEVTDEINDELQKELDMSKREMAAFKVKVRQLFNITE